MFYLSKNFGEMDKLTKFFSFGSFFFHVMKRKISVSRSRSPIYAVLIIITIIAFIFLVRVIGNNDLFNNSRVNGEYQGTVNIYGQSQIDLNITFDGIGEIYGSMQIDDEIVEFNNNSYASFANEIHFFVSFPESEISFVFNGTVTSDSNLLTGIVQYYKTSDSFTEGTFYLSKFN